MTDPKKYIRQTVLPELGNEGQEKLSNTRVLVIGAGGLGCPVLLYLAAAGVGHITIIDPDMVDITNLHRQVLFGENDIGEFKAEVAAEKLIENHSDITIVPITRMLSKENALPLIAQHDVVVDGSDNFGTRYLVNDACVIKNKPLVFGSISRFEGQVSVFNYEDGPTYRCLFPEAPDNVPTCAEEGVIGILPGIIGSLQALEAIKVITGIGTVLSGELLTYQALTQEFNKFKFKTNPENKNRQSLEDSYEIICAPDRDVYVTLKDIEENSDHILVDVRPDSTKNDLSLGGEEIRDVEACIELYNQKQKRMILYCSTGLTSSKMVKILRDKGISDVFSLQGGLSAVDFDNLNL